MNRKYFATLLFVVACFTISAKAQLSVVATEGGKLKGYKDGAVAIFKGVPFAAPPVGQLRWKAPQPVVPWSGIKECTAFSASPVQPTPVPFAMWTEEFIAPPEPLVKIVCI